MQTQQLRRLFLVWSLTAVAAGQPGYYEELAAARAGTAMTVPVTDAIPELDGTGRRSKVPAVTRSEPFRPATPTSDAPCWATRAYHLLINDGTSVVIILDVIVPAN
jgi:hypothetical protein